MHRPLQALWRTPRQIKNWFTTAIADWTQAFVEAYHTRAEVIYGLKIADGGDTANDHTSDLDFTAGAVRLNGPIYDTAAITALDVFLPTATALTATSFTAHHPITKLGTEVNSDGGPDLSDADLDFVKVSVVLIDSDEDGGAGGYARFLAIVNDLNVDEYLTSAEIAAAIEASRGETKDFTGNAGWVIVGQFLFNRNDTAFECTAVDNRNNYRNL